MVRVGLVGCGAWGRFILRDLVSLGCEVAVVARSERSSATAHEGGAATRRRLDRRAARASTGSSSQRRRSTHAAVVEEALERGVPVFVEKPLTDDPDDADRLAAAAPERLFVMDKWRYHPGVELLGDDRAERRARPRDRPADDADRLGEPARRRRRDLDPRAARPRRSGSRSSASLPPPRSGGRRRRRRRRDRARRRARRRALARARGLGAVDRPSAGDHAGLRRGRRVLPDGYGDHVQIARAPIRTDTTARARAAPDLDRVSAPARAARVRRAPRRRPTAAQQRRRGSRDRAADLRAARARRAVA